MPINSKDFRSVMGTFATGVTIITTIDNGKPKGITANSFTSVSLEPPLVMFCLGKDSTNFEAFMSSNFFAVNILSANQEELSNKFALFEGDRFAGIKWSIWETGAPILSNVISAVDCRRATTHDAGDHIIMLGQVLRADILNAPQPLLYFQGSYSRVRENS